MRTISGVVRTRQVQIDAIDDRHRETQSNGRFYEADLPAFTTRTAQESADRRGA